MKSLKASGIYTLGCFCDCGESYLTGKQGALLGRMPLSDGIHHEIGDRQAFLQAALEQATPEQRQLCNELLQLAGGLDEALAAAFGASVTEFLSCTRSSQFRRRDFLTKVAAAAAVVTLASCFNNQSQAPIQSLTASTAATEKLEKTDITLGFLPITCATPILVAETQGIYQKYGLNVTLKKLPNWAAVRESAIAGELDAYHMLSPMPISISLGLGSSAFPIKLASIENTNGQSIVLAQKYKDRVKGSADFKGLKIAIPFPFSMHNLLLRYYLAAGNLNPDKDVKLQIMPPADAIAQLATEQIDGFILPDNFGQRAVAQKIGFIHLLTRDLWAGHPCCSFAASRVWIDANPNTFRAVNKAITEAAAYANAAENRPVIAQTLSERKYLNQPEPVLKAVLTGKFEDGLGKTLDVPDRVGFDPYPWKSFATWISSQFVRWNLLPKDKADYPAIAEQIYLTDLARELAKELGQTPSSKETRTETLKFDTFDPANPAAYVEAQIKKFNV